jgi:hypothetical protein
MGRFKFVQIGDTDAQGRNYNLGRTLVKRRNVSGVSIHEVGFHYGFIRQQKIAHQSICLRLLLLVAEVFRRVEPAPQVEHWLDDDSTGGSVAAVPYLNRNRNMGAPAVEREGFSYRQICNRYPWPGRGVQLFSRNLGNQERSLGGLILRGTLSRHLVQSESGRFLISRERPVGYLVVSGSGIGRNSRGIGGNRSGISLISDNSTDNELEESQQAGNNQCALGKFKLPLFELFIALAGLSLLILYFIETAVNQDGIALIMYILSVFLLIVCGQIVVYLCSGICGADNGGI